MSAFVYPEVGAEVVLTLLDGTDVVGLVADLDGEAIVLRRGRRLATYPVSMLVGWIAR